MITRPHYRLSLFLACFFLLNGCHKTPKEDFIIKRPLDFSMSCRDIEKELKDLESHIIVFNEMAKFAVYKYEASIEKDKREKRYNHLVELGNNKKCFIKEQVWTRY